MMLRALYRGSLLLLGLLIAATVFTALAAANTVPASKLGYTSANVPVAAAAPAQCAGLALTRIVTVTGSRPRFTDLVGFSLVLVSSTDGQIKNSTNNADCFVVGGTSNHVVGNNLNDVCIDMTGTNQFTNCAFVY